MRNFEVLPHTADTRLKVKGDSFKELFFAALEGMNSIIKGDIEIKYSIASNESIIIDSVEPSVLLIDFLSEILTLTHRKKQLYFISGFDKFNEYHIECNLNGYEISGFDEDIKAVTYTEVNIIRTEENLFETIIVFDI